MYDLSFGSAAGITTTPIFPLLSLICPRTLTLTRRVPNEAFPQGYCTGLGGAVVKTGSNASVLPSSAQQQQQQEHLRPQKEKEEEKKEKEKEEEPDQHALWTADEFVS